MKNRKSTIFLVSFFILLSAVFMAYYNKDIRTRQDNLRVIGNPGHKVGSFSFLNQDGKTITDKDVDGKIRVVEYFFTTCKGICPRMNENMNKVYEEFRGNKNVVILSHTVDPYKDTVEALKAYSLRFEADPEQWMFLTGDKKELYDIARYGYLVSAVDDTTTVDIQSDFIHTNHFVLVDGHGRIRSKFYDGTSEESVGELIKDIHILLREQAEEQKKS